MSRRLVIDGMSVSDDGDAFVVAEIGHNHQGSVETAKELFRRAKECGVNAVKLQKRDNRSLYTKGLYEAAYNNENSYGATYGAHREALEFGRDEYVALQRFAAELGVVFFATAFDFASADFLASLDMPAYKIASGDLKNTPLIRHIARFGKPVFLSTGGGTLDDVQRAYDAFMPINQQLCVLQCTASYPVEPEDMHLRVLTTYRQRFHDVLIGLSDHQSGIAMAVAAYVLGARVIEKHFTLNRAARGTDHAFSLEPVGMRKLVRDLRRTRVALGDGTKKPLPCEVKPLFKMGKKLVAAADLPAGRVLRREDVAIKSPNDGMPPYGFDDVIGRVIVAPMKADENISLDKLGAKCEP